NDINLYMGLLKEELATLWDAPANTWDAAAEEYFPMRAALLTTVHDFLGYGYVAGQVVHGFNACVRCMDDTTYRQLDRDPGSSKTVFMGHRRWLRDEDPWRKRKDLFDGQDEPRRRPRTRSGEQIDELLKNWKECPPPGKKRKAPEPLLKVWKTRSVFWDLPYWKILRVPHSLDVMHITKNVCESLLGTLLNMPERTKDGPKARSNVDPNNVPLASLVAQEEHVDVNFIKNNNFNNNAYRNNYGNNYRPYPSHNSNGYDNSYGNSYNNNRSVAPGLEAMLKEFISTQTAFNKSVEENLGKIDIIASKVDSLVADVDLLKLKIMPNEDKDTKSFATANAIQVGINENIRLMAELHARWGREENEKLAKEDNVAKVWTITTTSNDDVSHVAKPPTINGKIIGVSNVSTPSAKRAKLPEIAKLAKLLVIKLLKFFKILGTMIPLL
ncbi:hypothetical protein QYE76_007670, partial [Lolium multiflorum]